MSVPILPPEPPSPQPSPLKGEGACPTTSRRHTSSPYLLGSPSFCSSRRVGGTLWAVPARRRLLQALRSSPWKDRMFVPILPLPLGERIEVRGYLIRSAPAQTFRLLFWLTTRRFPTGLPHPSPEPPSPQPSPLKGEGTCPTTSRRHPSSPYILGAPSFCSSRRVGGTLWAVPARRRLLQALRSSPMFSLFCSSRRVGGTLRAVPARRRLLQALCSSPEKMKDRMSVSYKFLRLLFKEPWRDFLFWRETRLTQQDRPGSCQNKKYRHIFTGSVFLFFVPLANLSEAGVKNSLFAQYRRGRRLLQVLRASDISPRQCPISILRIASFLKW